MKVLRDGQVLSQNVLRGWVDRYDPARPSKSSRKWRGIRQGGVSRAGFARRDEAAAWVCAA